MSNFQKIAVGGQVLDAVAAIAEDAAIAVEECHAADGRAGVGIALVERDAASGGQQLGDIDAAFLLGADQDRELEVLAIELDASGFSGCRLLLQDRAHVRWRLKAVDAAGGDSIAQV